VARHEDSSTAVCFIHWERADSKKGKNVRGRGCSLLQAVLHKQIKEHVYSPNANVRDNADPMPPSCGRAYITAGAKESARHASICRLVGGPLCSASATCAPSTSRVPGRSPRHHTHNPKRQGERLPRGCAAAPRRRRCARGRGRWRRTSSSSATSPSMGRAPGTTWRAQLVPIDRLLFFLLACVCSCLWVLHTQMKTNFARTLN
jgi:hypothetical protein